MSLVFTYLGGLELSFGLELNGLDNAPVVRHSARPTFGGFAVQVLSFTPGVGRALSLNSQNHITRSQLLAIRSLAEAGEPVTLVHHLGTFNVLITGVELEPDEVIADPDDSLAVRGYEVWYSGTIYLQEV